MTSNERTWAIWSHLGALAGYLVAFGSFIVPLVIWLSKKEESPVVAEHAKASLNFQLSTLLYSIIAGLMILLLIGIPFLIIIPIFNLVCVVLAAIEADKGRLFNYPLSIRFVS